jgi:hypothetical protein
VAQGPGLGLLQSQRLDDDDAAVRGLGGKRVLEGERAHLLRQADGVAARLWAKCTAAAAKQIDPRRAVPGIAGALLPVHFLAGARDVRAIFHRVRTALAFGQLPHHATMDDVGARL